VYDRSLLEHGNRVSGPVLVEEQGATTWVPRGWRLAVDDLGNLLVSKSYPIARRGRGR
jgi:N-methylhydantoinase A/oxoprolinase/acetone carboxylase beta subunit